MKRYQIQCVIDADLSPTAESQTLDLEIAGEFHLFGGVVDLLADELELNKSDGSLAVFSQLYEAVIDPCAEVDSLAFLSGDIWRVQREDPRDPMFTSPSLAVAKVAVVQMNGAQAGRLVWLADGEDLTIGPWTGQTKRTIIQGEVDAVTASLSNGVLTFGQGVPEVAIGATFVVDLVTYRLLAPADVQELYSPDGTFGAPIAASPHLAAYTPLDLNMPSLPAERDRGNAWPLAIIAGGVATALLYLAIFRRPEFVLLVAVSVGVALLVHWQQNRRTGADHVERLTAYALAAARTLKQAQDAAVAEP